MTYRIAWLSPLTPASGVGTFSDAITRQFPSSFEDGPIDLTILYVGHDKLYRSPHRSIEIGDGEDFRQILTLFDLLIYNIGNNRAHHEPIFTLLRLHPGIVICHDYVYQHYLAERSLRTGKSFASFAALLLAYGDGAASTYLRRSRITSRLGARYSPWDSEASVQQPMSDVLLPLGSGLVVHSSFARRHAEQRFAGPILQLGMPHDQKPSEAIGDLKAWTGQVTGRHRFELVSFGHVQPTKCIDLVIAAIAASPVLRRRIHYTVAGFVGDTAYFERLKAMAATLSLQDCVTFEPDISDRRLGELMQKADIFSNLRRPNTEGSSVSLIEQLDTGRPVVVIDSGCYCDLPADAAVKLAADVDSASIRKALERLIDEPDSLPAIGRAGRAYARRWTCASYAQELLRFVSANRPLLERRAKRGAVWSPPSIGPIGPGDAARPGTVPVDATPRYEGPSDETSDVAWADGLARARLRLTYFDRNMLAVDPAIILHKTNEALCDYAAHVLLGIFGDARLERALSRFFVKLDRRSAYWACVRFAVLADAVFVEDEAARERLINMRPDHDVAFWCVIEALPARQCITAATLMLARRLPKADELCVTGLDDHDGFPKRLRIAELVRTMKPAPGSSLDQLARNLLESCAPALERALPPIETDLECEVGSAAFRARVDMSGFYAPEVDHAWTRGHQGFLGLRLGTRPVEVELLAYHISAAVERPASIRMSHDGVATSIEVKDSQPRWLSLAIPAATAPRTVWLQASTDVAAVPVNSHDTRLLGLCCLRLRVKAQGEVQPKPGGSRLLMPGLLKPVTAGLTSNGSTPRPSTRGARLFKSAAVKRALTLLAASPRRLSPGLSSGNYWQVIGKISRPLPIKQCTILLSKILVLSGRTLRKGLLI